MKVLVVFGTRPEAIKMAPVVHALQRAGPRIQHRVCVTAQHRQMLDQVLHAFRLTPDDDLDLMSKAQGLSELAGNVLRGMDRVLASYEPDVVLVQGDTTTTFAASLAAYHRRVRVAHVEAGLRTGDMLAPWPEEGNRRLTSVLADLHFAPTEAARANLLREGVDPARVLVTGNTVIDALLFASARLDDAATRQDVEARLPKLDPGKRLVLVTGHRRESFGESFRSVCEALREIAATRDDVEIVFPVHLNPNVREPAHKILGGMDRIHLTEPLEYLPFVHLMKRAHIIISDSGGIQEEAPTLGKPVLVTRDVTERPEAIANGANLLVGTDRARIVHECRRLLDDRGAYDRMSTAGNPYGDGKAAERIVARLVSG